MKYQKILYEVKDNVSHIKLNSPQNYNALSLTSWHEIADAFQQAQCDSSVYSILLCAEGKAFSSGFDMDDSIGMKDASQFEQWKYLQEERDCIRQIWEVNKPVVAAIQGYCLGSGFELSLLADIVVASDDAIFGETELRFSTIPQPTLLFMIGLRSAKEVLMLADRITAQEAYRMGIVNRLVPRENLEAESLYLALKMSKLPTETMQITKNIINKIVDAQGYRSFNDWSFDLLHVTKNMPTKVNSEFERISREQGMKAALAWMNQRYS
jgi:enoyl-CoA hydratase